MINQIYPSIYLGDSSVQRIYSGDDLIYLNGTPDILLEYISNGASSTTPNVFFSTGVPGSLTNKVEIKYSYHTQMDSTVLFGVGTSSNATYYYVPLYANTSLLPGSTVKFWCRNVDGYSSVVPTVDTPHVLTTYSTYTSSSAATAVNVILDGQLTSRSYTISSSITGTGSMYMFAKHNAENNTQAASMFAPADTRIYYMKIWRDNNLIRFYIPVLHYTNGQYTPCFYDKVNDTYIYNLGTDTPTYKISGDYLLDYIQNGPDSNDDVNAKYGTGVDTSINLLWDAIFRTPTLWTSDNVIMGCGSLTEKVPPEVGITYTHQSLYQAQYALGPRAINGVYYNSSSSSYSGCEFSTPSSYRTDEKKTMSIFVSNNNFGMSLYDSSSGLWQVTTQKFGLPEYVPTGQITLFGLFQMSNPYPQYSRNTKGGARIYALNFRYANNTPAKTFIPVLHNNQAVFLDLNSGTYIYNLGTATPVYQFTISHPDIPLTYIANGPDSDSASIKNVYFDTGVLANANTKCEMKTAIPAYKAQWFCGGCTNGFIGFEMGVSAYHRPYTRIGGYLENGQNTYTNDIQLDVPYTTTLYHNGTNQITVFDSETATTTSGDVNPNRFSSTQTIILLARGLDGTIHTAASYSGMKIYYTKIWSGNTLIRSYVPVLHWLNNKYVPCFYDEVNDNYIYNLGTDTPAYLL